MHTNLNAAPHGTTTVPAIDMVDPGQACRMLDIGDAELLALVNGDRLAAYQLDSQIRFRYRDVESLASRRAIAA